MSLIKFTIVYLAIVVVGGIGCGMGIVWSVDAYSAHKNEQRIEQLTGMSADDLKATLAQKRDECKTMPEAKRADWWTVKK